MGIPHWTDWAFVAGLACVSACAHANTPAGTGEATGPSEATPQAPTTGSATPAEGEGDVTGHMQANFAWAIKARDAIAEGRLEEARGHARALREQGAWPGFPPDWKHYLEQMRQRADEIVLAGSLEEAAVAVGLLGLSCGNCHWYSEQGPDHPRLPPLEWEDPPEPVDKRMLRHEIGMAQMWVGLMEPSEDAWRSGTITLTRAPMKPPEQHGEPVGEVEQGELEQIRALAKQARVAGSHDERAQVYGQLLVQCAGCHQVTPR